MLSPGPKRGRRDVSAYAKALTRDPGLMQRMTRQTGYELPRHRSITPPILYFGTPVALITTMSPDGRDNVGPMSSAWALGYTVVMGWEWTAQTLANLEAERECVVNLPDPGLVEQVEAL